MFRDTRNLPNPSRWSIIFTQMKSPKNPNRPRGGRPPKPETERLKRRLVVCLTETDYDALCRKARVAGLVCAEYARRALARSIVRARMTPEMLALLRQLTGMANNLNQLTKLSHQRGFHETHVYVVDLLRRLKEILGEYRQASYKPKPSSMGRKEDTT